MTEFPEDQPSALAPDSAPDSLVADFQARRDRLDQRLLSLEELIAELREELTIVIVTHSMQQAGRVSQRTAFFYMGSLIEVGTTRDVFTRPREQRTEDYISGRFG